MPISVLIILNLINFILCNGNGQYFNESFHDETLVWSHFLEEHVTSRDALQSARKGRDMMYSPAINVISEHPVSRYNPNINDLYISKRIGEAVELEPHMRPPTKLLNTQYRPTGAHQQQQQQHPQQHAPKPTLPFRAVTENDLYLLGAIEKLVYRIDNLESQVRRTERLVYYLLSDHQHNENEVRDACPKNFARIGENCYYINTDSKANWKTANAACKSSMAHLAEFEKASENEDLIAYILNQPNYRGQNFWLGGLNPGLLWIWANSAKPVNPKTNLTSIAMSQQIKNNGTTNSFSVTSPSNDIDDDDNSISNESILNNVVEIKGTGPCLSLSYNSAKHSYLYSGLECAFKQHYICEYEDKTLHNKIKKISRQLNLD